MKTTKAAKTWKTKVIEKGSLTCTDDIFPRRAFVDSHYGTLTWKKSGPRVSVSLNSLERSKFKSRDTEHSKTWGSNILKKTGPQGEINLTFFGSFSTQGICRFLNCAGLEAKKSSRNLQLETKNDAKYSVDHRVKKKRIGVQSPPRIRGHGKHLHTFSGEPQRKYSSSKNRLEIDYPQCTKVIHPFSNCLPEKINYSLEKNKIIFFYNVTLSQKSSDMPGRQQWVKTKRKRKYKQTHR